MSSSPSEKTTRAIARQVSRRHLRAMAQRRLGAFNMDMFARLSILEGAAGVPPGKWLRKGERGFGDALEFFGASLAPAWTSVRDQKVYDQALSAAAKPLAGVQSLDADDLVQDLIVNSTNPSGPDRTRLFYAVGSKLKSHKSNLGAGKITPRDPLITGAVRRWVVRSAIDHIRAHRLRVTLPIDRDGGPSVPATRQAPIQEKVESLMLLALQSPGGPGNEIRRIVDRLINQSFAPRERPIVRAFLQKIAEPKYRSVQQMKKMVTRFDPKRWFKQAYLLVRKEIMSELGVSAQELTNALGGSGRKVFKFMRDRVGRDPTVKKTIADLAEEIDLMEPGFARIGKPRKSELSEEQTPKDPWSKVIEWLRQEGSLWGDGEKDSSLKDFFEKDDYYDWNHTQGPHAVFDRGPTPLRVSGEEGPEESSEISVTEWLATEPKNRTAPKVRDDRGNIFTGLVQVKGTPTIETSEIRDRAQINHHAVVKGSTVRDNAIVESEAKVSQSDISGDARIRGQTVINNAKVTGGSWDGQRIDEGYKGTFTDVYEQDVLDVLMSLSTTVPGAGDAPIKAMARFFADGNSTTGPFGVQEELDTKALAKKVQEHIYEKHDDDDPRLGRGAALLDELDEESFKKLLGAAKEKAADMKAKKTGSFVDHQVLRRLAETAFVRTDLRADLLPFVKLGLTARTASHDVDLRGLLVRAAYTTDKPELRKVFLSSLWAQEQKPLGKTAQNQGRARYRQPFLRWISNRKFTHPEPGHDDQVSFFTLPSEEQSRIYQGWQKDYKDWARRHMPEGLGDNTKVTNENFDKIEVGDVLWYNASPGRLLKVTGINTEGWRARNPTLELVQIDPDNPEFSGETRNVSKSTLRNPYLELHRLPGEGPAAQRQQEKERLEQGHRERKKRKEQVRAELPHEPRKGWPKFDDVGLGEAKQRKLQEAFKDMANVRNFRSISLGNIETKLERALGSLPSRKVLKEFMHALGDWAGELSQAAYRAGDDFKPQLKVYRAIRSKIDQGIRQLDQDDRQERRQRNDQRSQEREKARNEALKERRQRHQDRKELKGGGQKSLEDEAKLTSWFISQVLPVNADTEAKRKGKEQLKKATYQDLQNLLGAAEHIAENWDSEFSQNHTLVKHLGYDREGLQKLMKLMTRKLKDVHGRTYHPEVLQIANKYGLESEDADALYDWRADKPPRGRALSDQEKFNRFMAKAKPETRERMQGMNLADFMVMYKAILKEVLDEEEDEAQAA